MKTQDILLLGLAAVALTAFKGGIPTPSSNSAASIAPNNNQINSATSGPADRKNYLGTNDTIKVAAEKQFSGVNGPLGGVVVNPSGFILGDTMYNGNLRKSAEAQVANIQKSEGVNTVIKKTDNPLVVEYQTAGVTFRSARAPSNDAEREQARVSNVKDLISRGAYSDAKAADLKKKYNL